MARRRRVGAGVSIAVAVIVAVGLLGWLYARYVPGEAAERRCIAPAEGYACIPVGGFELSVYRKVSAEASGTPVLLLHGGPGFSSVPLAAAFDFLARGHPLYAFDQRGSGYSESRPDLADYDFADLVDEVEAVRREVVGRPKLILIGHSFGAWLALGYASKYPAHVGKIVLLSTPSARFDAGRLLDVLSLGIPPADQAGANDWLEARFPDLFASSFYRQEEAYRVHPGAMSYAVMMKAGRSLLDAAPAPGDLARITAPALILYGAADLPNSGAEEQRRLHAALPASELAEVPRSGHWTFLEQPAAVRDLIEAFLGR